MTDLAAPVHRVRWEHAAKRRYYEARLVRDLWGDQVIISAWGGVGSALGREVMRPVVSRVKWMDALDDIARRRRAHGYVEPLRS